MTRAPRRDVCNRNVPRSSIESGGGESGGGESGGGESGGGESGGGESGGSRPIRPMPGLESRERRRELPGVLRDRAAGRRREAGSRAAAVVARQRPHREAIDEALAVGPARQRGGVRQREDLGVGVVHADLRRDADHVT